MAQTPGDAEDALLDTGCLVCGMDDNHDKMLLCDSCVGEYHTYCLKPKLDSIPKDKWFCDVCKNGHDEVAVELEALVTALPAEHKARFGEICWAQGGVGYGWWPCCIFDPRWAKGRPLEEAKRQLGKRYLVYFYMCTDSPFALLPENKTMPWLEGLASNYYQGRAAKSHSRDRFSLFQKALLVATNEFDKTISQRQKLLDPSKKIIKAAEVNFATLSPHKLLAEPSPESPAAKRKIASNDEAVSKRSICKRVGSKNIFPRTPKIGKEKSLPTSDGHDSSIDVVSEHDSELICTVWQVSGADSVSTSKQVGFVILASKQSSTFEDVRKCISCEIDSLSKAAWQFCVPSLGPVSRVQERLFGPVLPFFAKRKLTDEIMIGDGTVHHPLRIHVLIQDK